MNRETPHWKARELDVNQMRISISAELPETRIFIDKLYREFTASGRRLQTKQIIQKRGRMSLLPVSRDDGWIAQLLVEIRRRDDEYEVAKKEFLAVKPRRMEWVDGRKPTREELHDRAGFR